MAGGPALGLLPRHPARRHFTYLDPHHRASGGRWHDSATVGDAMIPGYSPTVAVISENKDTALHFPELDGGVSVEGVGQGGATAAAFPWLRQCPNLLYWGDMDAAGFEILNGFREAGLAVTSVLMGLPTYERYEQFGTPIDRRASPSRRRCPRCRGPRPAPYKITQTEPRSVGRMGVEPRTQGLKVAALSVAWYRVMTVRVRKCTSVAILAGFWCRLVPGSFGFARNCVPASVRPGVLGRPVGRLRAGSVV